MLVIKNVNVYGLQESIVKSGYPMRTGEPKDLTQGLLVKSEDYLRAKKLGGVRSGTGHDNYLKGIIVQFDWNHSITLAKQVERYHWMDIVSSQSTMHCITKYEDIGFQLSKEVHPTITGLLNKWIQEYKDEKDSELKVIIFNRIIANLPGSFKQWVGYSTNYLQLKTVYKQRRTHKMKEWREFCGFLETLPMSYLITG